VIVCPSAVTRVVRERSAVHGAQAVDELPSGSPGEAERSDRPAFEAIAGRALRDRSDQGVPSGPASR